MTDCPQCGATMALGATCYHMPVVSETPALQPALTDYMTADSRAGRSAAFLRTYAERVRNKTAMSWEIPNTVATTLEDVANLIDSLAGAAETPAPARAGEAETPVCRHGLWLDGNCEACNLAAEVAALRQQLTEVERTIKSIAAMLGWENVPPRDSLEANIRAIKARVVTLEDAQGAMVLAGFPLADYDPDEVIEKLAAQVATLTQQLTDTVSRWEGTCRNLEEIRVLTHAAGEHGNYSLETTVDAVKRVVAQVATLTQENAGLKRKSAVDDIAFASANHFAVDAESRLALLTAGVQQIEQEIQARCQHNDHTWVDEQVGKWWKRLHTLANKDA
jgi:hypothetical protein